MCIIRVTGHFKQWASEFKVKCKYFVVIVDVLHKLVNKDCLLPVQWTMASPDLRRGDTIISHVRQKEIHPESQRNPSYLPKPSKSVKKLTKSS